MKPLLLLLPLCLIAACSVLLIGAFTPAAGDPRLDFPFLPMPVAPGVTSADFVADLPLLRLTLAANQWQGDQLKAGFIEGVTEDRRQHVFIEQTGRRRIRGVVFKSAASELGAQAFARLIDERYRAAGWLKTKTSQTDTRYALGTRHVSYSYSFECDSDFPEESYWTSLEVGDDAIRDPRFWPW